jgi:drug/metabolite transporter (DMT)-like permease
LRLGIGAIVLYVAVAATLNATPPPFTVLFDRPWAQPMPLMAAWVAVASAAVFCTALAYALYFRILATPGWFHASAATSPNRRSPRIAVAPLFCTTVPLREARDFAKACDFSEIA